MKPRPARVLQAANKRRTLSLADLHDTIDDGKVTIGPDVLRGRIDLSEKLGRHSCTGRPSAIRISQDVERAAQTSRRTHCRASLALRNARDGSAEVARHLAHEGPERRHPERPCQRSILEWLGPSKCLQEAGEVGVERATSREVKRTVGLPCGELVDDEYACQQPCRSDSMTPRGGGLQLVAKKP